MSGAPQAYEVGTQHIFDELRRIDLMLRRSVLINRHNRATSPAEGFEGLFVPEESVNELLQSNDLLSDPWRLDDETASRVAGYDQQIDSFRKAIDERLGATEQTGRHLPLPRLATLCGLSTPEVDLLLIALAPELEPRYETLYSYLHNDVTRRRPSVDLSLNLICRSKEEKAFARALLAGGAPLLHFRLIELHEESYDRQPTLLRRFLKVDETIVRFLLEQPPASLESGKLIIPTVSVPELEAAAATRLELENLATAFEREGAEHAVIQIGGGFNAPLDAAANALAHSFNKTILQIEIERQDADPAKLSGLVRDAALFDTVLVIRRPEAELPEADQKRLNQKEADLWALLQESSTPIMVLSRHENPGPQPPKNRLWRIDVQPPEYDTRRSAWRNALGEAVSAEDAGRLADMFPYSSGRIQQVASLAYSMAAIRNPSEPVPVMDDVLQAGRSALAPTLRRFARVTEPRFGWDDIVLPPDKMRQLRAVTSRVKRRGIVQRDWAFAEKFSRGLGISVLFAGPSGTGKTMAAEVLAHELHLDLTQIDLSAVVSKYIGETEKNLSVIFREAEFSQCLLFFDEADALFGKRTEVKDAHDRYANIEVNYLLQRIEQYEGLVVLATNFQKNLDEAFVRRLSDIIEFPFPDETLREKIWRQHFPDKAPLDSRINFPLIAQQFKLPGGKIRNAALNAAYLAAEEGGEKCTIRMDHIVTAVKSEFQKEGKLMMSSDLGSAKHLLNEVR